MSAIRQIFSVNSIVALGLVIGLVNNVAITAIFGLNRGIDAYFASLMLVKLFMVLVINYLGKNFLPVFAARRKESVGSASVLASLVVTQVGLAAAAATIVLVTFADQIFAVILPGFEPGEIAVVSGMFTIMAPSVLFMTIEVFHGYVWQHDERFSRVAFARIFSPLTFAIFILAFSPWLGIQSLPIGFLCGQIVTTFVISVGVPYKFRPEFRYSDPGLRKIVRNSIVLMGSGLIARSRSVIIPFFGSMLGEGAIAAIAIAQKICNPVTQSAQVGIRMIVFSRSARAVAQAKMDRIGQLHTVSLTGVLFFVSPIAAWYALEADVIIRAVFQRGAFTDTMADLVAAALIGYSLSVVFNGIIQIVSNGFYALDRIRVPAIAMPIGTLVFLGLAVVLGPAYGVFGLTLASSIAAMLLGLTLLTLFWRAIPAFDIFAVAVSFLKYAACALLAAIMAVEIRQWLDLETLPGFLVSALVVGTIYIAAMFLIRDRIFKMILSDLGVSIGRSGQANHH